MPWHLVLARRWEHVLGIGPGRLARSGRPPRGAAPLPGRWRPEHSPPRPGRPRARVPLLRLLEGLGPPHPPPLRPRQPRPPRHRGGGPDPLVATPRQHCPLLDSGDDLPGPPRPRPQHSDRSWGLATFVQGDLSVSEFCSQMKGMAGLP